MPKNPTETTSAAPESSSQTDTPNPADDNPQRLLDVLVATQRTGDPAALEDLLRRSRPHDPALVDLLLETVESLRTEAPEQAKELAKLGLRLAARLPNATFARVWDLWSTTCADLGLDDRADAGRTIAAIFDENLRSDPPGQTRGGRKRKGRRRKPSPR